MESNKMTPDKLRIPKRYIINFNVKKKTTREEILAEVKDRKAREKAARLNAEEQRLLAHKAREERLKKAVEEKAKLKKQRQEMTASILARSGPSEKQMARHNDYLKRRDRHEAKLIENFKRKNRLPPNSVVTYDREKNVYDVTTEMKPDADGSEAGGRQ